MLLEKYGKQYGILAKNVVGEEHEVVLENSDIQVVLSTKGGTVKSRKQAIAIGLSEARKKGAKVPRKKAA